MNTVESNLRSWAGKMRNGHYAANIKSAADEIARLEAKIAALEAERDQTTASQDVPGPQTHEEVRQFHEGFLAGVTA